MKAVLEGDMTEGAFTGDAAHINSDFINGMNNTDAKAAVINWLEENQKDLVKLTINYVTGYSLVNVIGENHSQLLCGKMEQCQF